MSLHTVEKSA